MINKKDCDIVTDLLPLYVEQLTQAETNQWILEHLSECERCRELHRWMEISFAEVLSEENQKKKLGKKQKKVKSLKRIKLRLLLWGYVLILLAIWGYCILDFLFFF